ncbi:MAG: hypothetical protein COW01_06190 [Bdellovibrionales bacterium CG12_big_fil_rev_8_21_14_0_65_38_15]|nr:MAG: hypothetical protein COW79_04085 [Bdellovibrionales bacterium CG22_combo_CG10-13_8_21_14_all_38_13]PIQ56017.1 MAG: hypothetical protein COW01_06190 [Bdellovibrionales bacterium CG12_big_fil_rev_8_21_14_0_65_38_15]PIR30622.1 MAG: hypothetical protein COV38_04730 [Bdellovibrionales bacterium CG11_big_fil_rev_8_21_14_0_20_38_13]
MSHVPTIPPAVKKQMDEGTFCPIPFIQLELSPLGSVSACCFSGEYKVGDVADQTIEEIWNGEIIQTWRNEFLTGDIKICEKAIKNFGCQKNYQHLNHLVEYKVIQSKMPQRLDLRLNGKCNLECVMCDVWSQPNGLYDKSDFWSIGPEKIYPYLKEVDMLGGEPFIQKDTFRFIEEVSKINKDCTWGFITNCHYRISKQLRDGLDGLKIRHIHLSMDAITTKTYAAIRLKGDFERVLETVMDYVSIRNEREIQGRGFTLFASICVQRDNWHELPEFLNFCDKHRIQPIVQELIGKHELSLQELKPQYKEELHTLYKEKIPNHYQGHIESILNNLGFID